MLCSMAGRSMTSCGVSRSSYAVPGGGRKFVVFLLQGEAGAGRTESLSLPGSRARSQSACIVARIPDVKGIRRGLDLLRRNASAGSEGPRCLSSTPARMEPRAGVLRGSGAGSGVQPGNLTNFLLRAPIHPLWRAVLPQAASTARSASVDYAFSVFRSVRPATAASRRSRDESW